MTLQEAIDHAKEVAKQQRNNGCVKCAEEHEQLANWLMELQRRRKKNE